MAHDASDHPLKQLEAALRVAPSPEATGRVRERVKLEPARASRAWWLVAAASVALLAAGIWSVTMLRHEPTPSSANLAANTAAAVEAVAPAVPTVRPRPVAPRMTRTTPRPATARPAVTLASSRSREPEVLVPPDEGIAIRRLLKAIREGRATAPAPGLRTMEDADGHLLEPTPIDIPLIKIELLPGTPVAGSGGTVK